MKICIIEDEERLAKALSQGLSTLGYRVDYFLDGEIGNQTLEFHHQDYDAAIIDLMLPNKSGLEICQNLRKNNSTYRCWF